MEKKQWGDPITRLNRSNDRDLNIAKRVE